MTPTAYQIKAEHLPLLIGERLDMIEGLNEGNKERQTGVKSSLNDVRKNRYVEEKYVVNGEMGKESYIKLIAKSGKEKGQILSSFAACFTITLNLDLIVESDVTYSRKRVTELASSAVNLKEKLQKLVYHKP